MVKVKPGCDCHKCTKKNIYDDDIGIIIQGPYTYTINQFEFIVKTYHGYKNVFIILHEHEPDLKNKTKILKQHPNINYAVCSAPDIAGSYNINMQTISTMSGLILLENLGFKRAIKIRSDMYFCPLERFLTGIKWDKLNFWCYTITCFNQEKPPWDTKKYISHKYNLNKEQEEKIVFGYPIDIIQAGPIQEMKLYFNFIETEESSLASPETKLIFNYLYNKGLSLDNSMEYLKKYIYFFKDILKEQKIDLYSIKRNFCNYSLGDHDDLRFQS